MTKGHVGIGFGSHVTLWEPDKKYFTINTVKLDFDVKNNWILEDTFNKYDLSKLDPAPKGGVRKIDFSPSGAVIKFSTTKGINDSASNVFAFSNFELSQDKFFFKPGKNESGNIINSYFVHFSPTESKVYTLEQPYLSVDTSKLSTGKTEISVKAWDKSGKDKAITAKFNVEIVENPLAVLEIESEFKEEVQISVAPGATIDHYFPPNYIKRGNSINYSIQYSEESGAKQHLIADVKEYINYQVRYDKYDGKAGPEILRTDSAAILFFSDDGNDEEKDSNYIQVYRCTSVSLGEDSCYLLKQMDLSTDKFELLRIQPKTYLGTTVFFLYNTQFKKTYMYFINYEEKSLNYELFDGKLIDA